MGSRRAVVLLTLVALAGCGGDDDDGNGTGVGTTATTPAETDPFAQDREARSHLRNLASAVEACFVDNQDYRPCTDPPGAGDVGEARMQQVSRLGYTIVSPSESGNEFRLVRGEDGSTSRECDEPGEAGCGAGGLW